MTLPDPLPPQCSSVSSSTRSSVGADFGSGFYELTAGSGRSGAELRTLIDHSIGPVWEANHVWLIYILVMSSSGFPAAFAAAMTTLLFPLCWHWLESCCAEPVLRFASTRRRSGSARLFGAVFAGSSLITPFFFGTVVGASHRGACPLADTATASARGSTRPRWSAERSPSRHVSSSQAFPHRRRGTGRQFVAGRSGCAANPRRRCPVRCGSCSPAWIRFSTTRRRSAAGCCTPGSEYSCWPESPVQHSESCCLLAEASAARISPSPQSSPSSPDGGLASTPGCSVDQLTIDAAAGAPATLTALLVVVALAVVFVLPPLVYLLRLTRSAHEGPTKYAPTAPFIVSPH